MAPSPFPSRAALPAHFTGAVLTVLSAFGVSVAFAAEPSVPVHIRLEVDRPVLAAGATERVVLKVGLEGVRLPRAEARPPVNLALVLDRSGSMSGDKIAQARAAALEAVRRLAADDIFSLVVYDTTAETVIPATRVGDAPRDLEARIRAIRPSGNTALFAGVSVGASELRKNLADRRYVHRLVLLSDGQANEGPSSPDELGRLGAALLKEGISVTTVGLGLGFNEDLMTRLASKSDGNTYFVEASADLPRIFAAELGDVLNVVARQLVVNVTFPEGVRPLGFVGRDGVLRGQRAELTLNQLYGGQEKFALIEAEIVANEDGARREFALAEVSYDEPAAPRRAKLEARATVTFTRDTTLVARSANQRVQADYAENRIALAKDTTVELADAGRHAEAAAALRARAQELALVGATYGNRAVTAVADANFAEADRLEREGMDNVKRKAYRASNAQTYNQQSSGSSTSASR